MSYEEGQRKLVDLWDAAETESSEDSCSEVEIDHISHGSYDSDTEEELNDVEDDPQEESMESENVLENEPVSSTRFMLGKCGTKWSCAPERINVRTRSENIIRDRSGVKFIGQNANKAVECWQLFITDEMLHQIVSHSNIQIKLKRDACRNSNTQKYTMYDTSLCEFKAFIGLLYLAGRFRSNRQNLKDLWRSDGSGVEIFRTIMTLKRFQFIQNCLRLDDKTTRKDRKKTDDLAAVRSFFEKFVNNCQAVYSPSEYVTIDEQLPSFRGRCSFRQYIDG